MSHLHFSILAFSTNFCPIKIDLSGNTVWPQASRFQKLAQMSIFGIFKNFCPLTMLKMRLFRRFSNTVINVNSGFQGGLILQIMGNSEMYFKKTKVGVNNLIFFGCKDYIQIHYACNEGKKSLSRSHPGSFCVSLSHVLKSFLFGETEERTPSSFSCSSCESCPPFGHLGWALWP